MLIISLIFICVSHESDNFKVLTDTVDYVVKYFSQKPERMREIMVLNDILYSKGVKLPKPIKTITNDLVVEYSSSETIVIQSFKLGKEICDRFDNPKEKMYNLMSWFGEQIGRLHYITKSMSQNFLITSRGSERTKESCARGKGRVKS